MWMNCGCDGTWTQMTTKQLPRPTICLPTGVTSAHPDCRLHTGSLLRTLCSASELKQKGQFPTSLGCISHLCTGAIYILTTAFTPGDSSSHQCSQGCGCYAWTFQNHHSPSTEENIWDSHLAPNCCSLPRQPQLKALRTCQANQLKFLRALWLGMPSLPQLSPMGVMEVVLL